MASAKFAGNPHIWARPIQSVPGGKASILGCHSIGHSKQKKKSVYVHVSYSERFPRWSYLTVQFQNIVQLRDITYCFSYRYLLFKWQCWYSYLVQYIFENSTVNINALSNSCEDMACCSSVQCTVLWNSSTSGTVQNRTHAPLHFLLGMTDTVTSQNTDFSSCNTLYSPESRSHTLSSCLGNPRAGRQQTAHGATILALQINSV
jgi:hypothetical protein